MHDTGCLGLVYWNDPEGWYGEGGGRRVQDGEHIYNFLIRIGLSRAPMLLKECGHGFIQNASLKFLKYAFLKSREVVRLCSVFSFLALSSTKMTT